ncbi:MFS transporter [Geothrix paludis]|uniref:MFS transporter n=1 Tax=Geothrix paludis TaxID=2922722 RepID=UPI001FADB9B7|nr:MFS transporter [Geothrix paludis]
MDAMTEGDRELRERRWALLALTSVGAFMTPLDGSIVSVALPRMGPLLNLSFAASLWVQAAYLLTIAVLLIPVGRLADQRGRVPFYLAGTVCFTLGSLMAALSRNDAALILARIVQGAGGALLSATSAAIVTAAFPPEERGRALGLNVMAVYLGLSVGPPLGGFLVDRFGWPWIFLVNLPIGAVVFLWGWRLLPRGAVHPPHHAAAPLDVAGAALLAVALAGLLVPLTFAAEWGWHGLRTWGLWASRCWPWPPSSAGSRGLRPPWWTWVSCGGTGSSRRPTSPRCSTTWPSTPSPSSPPSSCNWCRDAPPGRRAGSCWGSPSCRPS